MTLKILFLCTGNSCRSQMAEGWARQLWQGADLEPYSAGIESSRLDPDAVLAMQEVGVDISRQRSKDVDELASLQFDVVITVCDHASEHCPRYPGATSVRHVGFDDPPRLAAESGSRREALEHYRRFRDEIRKLVESLPESLAANR